MYKARQPKERALMGIDVSKAKRDGAWRRDRETREMKTRVFSNNPAGIERRLAG